MANKQQTGFVGIIRGLNDRFESTEEKLSELEKESAHFASNVGERLEETERLGRTITEAKRAIEALQARREQLKSDFISASFDDDSEAQEKITSERAKIDEQLEELSARRDKAEASRNRLQSGIATTRENAWEALDAIEPPSDDQLDEVISAVLEGIRAQRESIWSRMATVERNLELPDERAEREQQERVAERKREDAEKAAKRREIESRRNYYGKLLNNLSHLSEPHVGHRAWLDYLDEHQIEYSTQSTGHTTFIGKDENGKRTRLDPQIIVEDVHAAYYEATRELGEPVDDGEYQRPTARATRSGFASVMG